MQSKLDKKLIETLRTMARMIVEPRYGRSGTHLCQPDELVNEAILYYLKNKKRLRNHPNLPAYLIMKMKSLYIDIIRKSKRLVQLNTSEEDLESERLFKNITNVSGGLQEKLDVIQDIELYLMVTAKQICREILVLWSRGYTTNEMANIVGIAKGTVLSRLYNCRKDMIQFVTKEELPD
jgi:DNA-directed RNA polymerase specialized sigma24 family protein|tara:strand:- start:76 stop:612 length:537 start_codon:yes stop_codon:yes gene_type:complete